MRSVRLFLIVVAFASFSPAAWGQVATGFQPFGSFSGSTFDNVNNANLNVHFAIPVVNKAGRALPFYYNLSYDSSIWYPVTVNGTKTWTQVGGWGWHADTQVETGYITYNQTLDTCQVFNPDGTWWLSNYYYYSSFVYHDSIGGLHPFNAIVINADQDCGQSATSSTVTATDGSGYKIQATGGSSSLYPPTVTMYPRYGSQITPPLGSGLNNGTFEDANGNYVEAIWNSASKTTTYTDTLDTTALTVTTPAPPSSTTFQYSSASTSGQGTVTMHYTSYTVRTHFGCSGTVEFGPTTVYLVSSIVLDDGETYSFTYEPTPGFSGNYTGRIASVTLPTGGTINYTYTGGSNGITCADGSTATLTRQTPDGQWSYAHSESGTAWTTTVGGPLSYSATYNFQQVSGTQNAYETERQVAGLETVYTCYNGAAKPCNSTSITLPINRRTVWTVFGTKTSEVDTTYNTYGLPTEVDDYDWGPTLSRKTLITYNAALGNIVDHPSDITVRNSAGTIISSTTLNYDQTGVTGTSAPRHLSVTGPRGNLTTMASGGLTSTFTYFDTGNVYTSTDVNGAQTTYTYSACGNAFPTSISLPMSLSTSESWNCNGAVIASSTDANGKQTTFQYDNLNRLTTTSYPDGGSVTNSYSSNLLSSQISITGSTSRTDTASLDSLGRISSQLIRGVTTSTSYDSLGRVYTVSVSGSNAQDTFLYDGLGRPTKDTHADSNYAQASYSNNCVTTTDEAGKTRTICTDGLGRVISVTEDPGSSPHLNYATSYTYNPLDDLTLVTQGGQTRTYAYDGLGRLTNSTTPESGTTSYTYDTDASCNSTSHGDLVKRVDARTIRTCYVYDALHRLTSKNYNDTPQTPTANFYYDETLVVNGTTTVNTKGRMSHTWNGQSNTTYSYDSMGRVSDYWQSEPAHGSLWNTHYNYDLAGDVTSWTHPAGFTITNTVNTNQQVTQITSSLNDSTHPGTLATMTYKSWGALATLLNGCAGTGCVQRQETYDYNNRLQPVRIQLGTSSNNAANYCLVYNYYSGVANPTTCTATPSQGATGNNGNVMGYLYQDAANTSLQHSVAYTFDGVNRLASATAKDLSSNTLWTQSYIFTTDSSNGQYGNMTCMLGGSGYCPQVTFSSSTNRVSQIGSLNASFDSAGDMTGDGTHTYQWDAEGRMTSVDSGSTVTQKYNSLGQRVERFLPSGSWTFDYLFGVGGEELGLYSAGTAAWFDQDVSMGRRILVDYGSPLRILHTNKLGTTTVTTDQTGAELQDELFYPWGQDWTRAGQPYIMHFAGMQGFENPGLVYPTDFRKYNPALGRWMSPDPLAGDVSNPQSLNRYAYVLNNPVSNIDPLGLDSCPSTDDAATVDPMHPHTCIDVVGYPTPADPSENAGVLPPVSSGHPAGSDTGPYIHSAPPPKPKQQDTRQSCGSVYLNALAEWNTYDHAENTKQVAEAGAGAAAAESLKWQMERLLTVPLRSPYVRLFENATRFLGEASEVIPLAFATITFANADFAVAKARINGTCRPGF